MKLFLRQMQAINTATVKAKNRRQEVFRDPDRKEFATKLIRSIAQGLPLAWMLLLPHIASAEQIPTTPNGTWTKVSSTVATKTTPGGLTMTVTLTGAPMTFGVLNNTALQTTATKTTPILPSTTNGLQIVATSPSSCVASSLTCAGYGTISFSFKDPMGNAIKVKNPVLHVTRLGGSLSVTVNNVTKTALHGSILDLTTAGVALGAPSLGSRAFTTTPMQIKTDLSAFPTAAPSGSSIGDCIAAPAAPQAGCGSIPLTGLFSSLSFNESMYRRNVTANALPGWIESGKTAADGIYFTMSFDEDFGDAPASYDAGNAASHLVTDLMLGSSITADNVGTANGSSTGTVGIVGASPNAVAAGANNNGLNGDGTSDDGVASFPVLRTNSTGYILPVNLAGASNGGTVCGWIDFNNNGKFDPTEGICQTFVSGATSVNLNWTTTPGLSALAAGTKTYARIRASYDTNMSAATPTGRFSSGEVEDYQLKVEGIPDLKITKSHTGSFVRGQTGATYTINVINLATATGATSGLVTVADTLPQGLTATAISGGPNWNCTLSPLACTRSDSLAVGSSYEPITVTVSVANPLIFPPSSATNTATVSGGGDATPGNNTATDLTALVASSGDLTISKSHTGNFTPGAVGATYTLTGKNIGIGLFDSVSGTITVTDILPPGMTATAISGGPNWNCTLSPLKCTYTGASPVPINTSLPPITVTVNVATTATGILTNNASIATSGVESNKTNNSAADPTTIDVADLTITKTHTGTFTQQQQGATYTLTANNIGNIATNGLVTVTDTLPAGLTATDISGTGWTCTLSSLTCTRSDALVPGTSYPPITVTVDVSATATGSLTNNAAISGGGQFNTANDGASDSVTIVALPAPPITISGTLWDDANGSAAGFANIFSAGELGTSGGGLYAVLVDASDTVVASSPIATDGTYTLTKVPANKAGLKIRLTTLVGVVSKTAPLAEIYAEWVATSPIETATFTTGTSNITNQDFGIEQLPNTFDIFATDAIVNPNGTNQVVVPTLSGADPENGSLGSGNSFAILTLPTNGTLYYAGTAVLPGQVITNYDPALLTVDPKNGAVSIDFTYAAIDGAGKQSGNPGAVSMLFLANPSDFKIVKRITAINGISTINPSDNLTPLNQVLDNPATANDDPGVNWKPGYLVGAYNGGKIKPGDIVEYTVYFLNAKGANAKTIQLCDRIINKQTYQAGSMELRLGAATTSIALTDNPLDLSIDRGAFYATSASAPATCNLVPLGSNTDNGTVVVDITGTGSTVQPTLTTVPSATAPGVPTTSYGFIRFKTKVNP